MKQKVTGCHPNQNYDMSGVPKGSKVESIIPPFIKFEDANLNYRPVYDELKSVPIVLTEANIRTCPFYYPHRGNLEQHLEQVTKNIDNVQPVQNFVGFLHSSGYCELCDKEFQHITIHIKSKPHNKNARNENIFKEMDEVIEKGFLREKNPLMTRDLTKVWILPNLLSADIPVNNVKYLKTEKSDIKVGTIYTAGIYHHPKMNQGITISYKKTVPGEIQPLCVEYLTKSTTDSAVHPQIFSLSTFKIPLYNLSGNDLKANLCIIESSCMFVSKNKKLPMECPNDVKLDYFLLEIPQYDFHIMFSLYSHPKSLANTLKVDGTKVDNDDLGSMWSISDIIRSIKNINFHH